MDVVGTVSETTALMKERAPSLEVRRIARARFIDDHR